eukprot:scaffold2092_cov275-Prasinococcus_capsulatus_cf.AAC.1
MKKRAAAEPPIGGCYKFCRPIAEPSLIDCFELPLLHPSTRSPLPAAPPTASESDARPPCVGEECIRRAAQHLCALNHTSRNSCHKASYGTIKNRHSVRTRTFHHV